MADDKIVYQIEVKRPVVFNPVSGLHEEQKAYNSPAWNAEGAPSFRDGKATTENPVAAMEWIEAGAEVTPDPRPLLQEKTLKQLEKLAADDVDGEMRARSQLEVYLQEVNEWRAAHGVELLPVPAEDKEEE